MANKQINELTEKTNMVGEDLIPIYDSAEAGSEKTKKITLDAFGEYGAFTPEIADAITGGNVGSAGSIGGVYEKIGRMVHCHIAVANINTTGMTGGNTFFIRNLPFTPGVYWHVGQVWLQSITINGVYAIAVIDGSNGVLKIEEMNSGGSHTDILVSDLVDDQADMTINITYFT